MMRLYGLVQMVIKVLQSGYTILVLVLILSGCSNKDVKPEPEQITKIVSVKQLIPEEFLECDALPDIPIITLADKESVVMRWSAKLWKVADECKSNLIKIKELQNK